MVNFASFKMKLKYSKLGFKHIWKHFFGLGNISSISNFNGENWDPLFAIFPSGPYVQVMLPSENLNPFPSEHSKYAFTFAFGIFTEARFNIHPTKAIHRVKFSSKYFGNHGRITENEICCTGLLHFCSFWPILGSIWSIFGAQRSKRTKIINAISVGMWLARVNNRNESDWYEIHSVLFWNT